MAISKDELDQLALKYRPRKVPRIVVPQSPALTKNRLETGRLLKSYLEKTGLPFDELNRLSAERQAEERRLVASQAAQIAQAVNEQDAAFRKAMESQRASRVRPTITLTTLEQPMDIALGGGHINPVDVFETHFEPLGSFAKLRIHHTKSGDDTPSVFFVYWWDNPHSDAYALIFIGTLLRLNGYCDLIAQKGLFSGDLVSLQVQAHLNLALIDPSGTVTPLPYPSAQFVQYIYASGDGFWGSDDEQTFNFGGRAVGLDIDFLIIPPGNRVVMDVELELAYGFSHEGVFDGHRDVVDIDFATDENNRKIYCPFVHIENYSEPG